MAESSQSCQPDFDRGLYFFMSSIVRVARLLMVGVLISSVAACAAYRPEPLQGPDVEASLQDPAVPSLVQQAGGLRHALIAPVVLDPSAPLTLDAVTVIAVIANPDLAALRVQQQVADAQVFASGLFPDPQLSLGIDRVLSPSGAGLVTAYTGGLSLDVLGKFFTRRTDQEVARNAARQLRLDVAWAEWNTGGGARLQAIRQHYLARIDVLGRSAAVLATRLLESIDDAVARGDLKGDDLQAQRNAALDVALRADTASKALEANRLELNHMLGLRPDSAVRLATLVVGEPPTLPSTAELFAAARRQRLDLQALEQGYAGQEANVARAVLGQYPRVGITLNRARDTSAVHTWGPAVNLDLPLWNRNRGEIALTSATRAQLRAEFVARLHQTRADIVTLVAALNTDQRTLRTARGEATLLQGSVAAYEAAAERGDLTRGVVDATRLTAIDKQIAVLSLEQSCAEQRVALALMTGDPFP